MRRGARVSLLYLEYFSLSYPVSCVNLSMLSLILSVSLSLFLTFTPEVLTCCTLYNHHCDYYYLTLLVIYKHLNILAMFCYHLHPAQPEEEWPSLIAWFLSRFPPRFWPF